MGPEVAVEALHLTLLLSLPALAAAAIVGVLSGLVGALTQLSEPALSAVPRVLAVGAALSVAGVWMGSELSTYTRELWERLPGLVP